MPYFITVIVSRKTLRSAAKKIDKVQVKRLITPAGTQRCAPAWHEREEVTTLIKRKSKLNTA